MEKVQKKKIVIASCVAAVIILAILITVIYLYAPRKMTSAVSDENIDYVKITMKTPQLETVTFDPVERILSDEEEKEFIDELNSSSYKESYRIYKKTTELNIYVYYTDGSVTEFNSVRVSKDGEYIEFADITFNFSKFVTDEMNERYEEILREYEQILAEQAGMDGGNATIS